MFPLQEGKAMAYAGTNLLTRGVVCASRCQANMAHMRQSRPDSGLGFQIKVLKTFSVVPSWLGREAHPTQLSVFPGSAALLLLCSISAVERI